jgi:hypothetical protein
MPLLAVMSDLDLIESPSADQAHSCLKLVFAASHTMIFERLPCKMYLCNAKAVVHSCCIFVKECLKVYSWLLSGYRGAALAGGLIVDQTVDQITPVAGTIIKQ